MGNTLIGVAQQWARGVNLASIFPRSQCNQASMEWAWWNVFHGGPRCILEAVISYQHLAWNQGFSGAPPSMGHIRQVKYLRANYPSQMWFGWKAPAKRHISVMCRETRLTVTKHDTNKDEIMNAAEKISGPFTFPTTFYVAAFLLKWKECNSSGSP